MKKIVFVLQVFTLMAVFPLYVFLEMNHATMPPTENNIAPEITGDLKMNSTDYSPKQIYKLKISNPVRGER